MNNSINRVIADMNRGVVGIFRSNLGVVGGPFQGKRIVLLHHTGRRSGDRYVTPLVSAADGDTFLVCGSAGGAPSDPLWVNNIEAGTGETIIEVAELTLRVRTAVIRESSPDWERLYAIWSSYWPDAHEYERKTSRKFPVVRLEPVKPTT
ncbi:cell entry (mce) related family protein [Mycobacteroides abscessus subsp. abscessus]|uniref:nitroreductase/quinone reductase family protein n=1 Tax=Mycobacteroides abscessus TaxID=36809 RepID=UPI0009297308|nr:nitroreductase/quinone reductase family protein [Mycobacteroides abscessus]SHP38843.1 cell entry (mce) related family protein [Mycobacteroides abscessus subsp. abscessus]SHS05053.1 cell entry (mce) related family protein [Mycobacteroides abscessus subsp. abscessus]SHS26299.1 cell entry (mce) related family protein [Mycobacteroides abscessus subsp. abscessus]SHT06752.1 cell entry (mce) related family protein [Mycobacteroides abscessus subsp. abscessus]SKD51423.1 cell entry (mce) related fami